MASLLNNLLPSVFGSAKSTKPRDEEDNALVPQTVSRTQTSLTSAKRTASTNAERPASRKRVRRLFKVSEEEKRLVPGNQQPSSRAIPISIPKNEWTARRKSPPLEMKRKVPAGGVKPTNTLNRSTFSNSTAFPKPITLDTRASVGDNVPAHTPAPYFPGELPSKRRRLAQQAQSEAIANPVSHAMPPSESAVESVEAEVWFDREQVVSPTRARLPSTVTIDSQDDVVRQKRHDDLFHSNEIRVLDRTLRSRPKGRLRKATSVSASNSQVDQKEIIEIQDSQSSHTSFMKPPAASPVGPRATPGVLPDDNVAVIIEQSPRHTKARASPSARPSRRPEIEVPSAFGALAALNREAVPKKQGHDKLQSPSSKTLRPSNQKSHASPARLMDAFVRDEHSHAPKKQTLRQKMLAASDSPENKFTAEGSEDELALGVSTIAHKPRTANRKPRRSASPNDIRPTVFSTPRTGKSRRSQPVEAAEAEQDPDECLTFPLERILTQSVEYAGNDLTLTFSFSKKGFIVEREGRPLLAPNQEQPYIISHQHAKSVMWNPVLDFSLHLAGGVRDNATGGDIFLTFTASNDLEKCLELVKLMTSDKVTVKENKDMFSSDRAIAAARARFKHQQKGHSGEMGQDAEIVAMAKRRERGQNMTESALPTRERTRGLQKETNLLHESTATSSEPNSAKRKTVMQSEFTDHATRPQHGSSPLLAPERTPSQRLTRKSGRLQNQESTPLQGEPYFYRWTLQNKLPNWENPLVYPPTGPKRTTVEIQDIERLDEGEFLNDSIISFCLRRLEESRPDLKDKVHFFNTFFYTSLSTKQGRRSFNYDAVKRWTKNIDIFSYPFVVVPVNANLHWFVTIICNLDKLGRKLVDDDDDGEENDKDMLDNKIETTAANGLPMELPDSQEEQKAEHVREKVGRLSLSDGDDRTASGSKQANATSNDVGPTATPESSEQVAKPAHALARKGKREAPVQKLHPDQTAIITLDSLGGSHNIEVRNLKDYVVQEGQEKRGMSIGRQEIKGIVARGIPEQTNFCDCGVYLVGYVEAFLKSPAEFVRKVLSRELDRSNDFKDFDPSLKRSKIREDLFALEKEQQDAKKERKKADRDARVAAQRQRDGVSHNSASTKEIASSRAATPATGSSSGEDRMHGSDEPTAKKIKAAAKADETRDQALGNESETSISENAFLEGLEKAT